MIGLLQFTGLPLKDSPFFMRKMFNNMTHKQFRDKYPGVVWEPDQRTYLYYIAYLIHKYMMEGTPALKIIKTL